MNGIDQLATIPYLIGKPWVLVLKLMLFDPCNPFIVSVKVPPKKGLLDTQSPLYSQYTVLLFLRKQHYVIILTMIVCKTMKPDNVLHFCLENGIKHLINYHNCN